MGFTSFFSSSSVGSTALPTSAAAASSSATETASGVMQLGRQALGIEQNDSLCPSMSMETRLYGFVGCFAGGWLLSFGSLFALSTANITAFVIFYTLGNVTALCSTFFLMGPMKQLKSMFDPSRAVSAVVFLGLLIGTLIVAIATKNIVATVLMVVAQWIAATWYSISYIPFARQAVLSCCKSSVGSVAGGI
jgi:hypothetical protein